MSTVCSPRLQIAAMPFVDSDGHRASGDISFIADRLDEAARAGIDLAVFPELNMTPVIGMSVERRGDLAALAEPVDGRSIGLVRAAVEKTGVGAGVGWIERAPDGRFYNSYAICLPDGAYHCHRKLYPAEHRHLSRGEHHTVFDTRWGLRMSILTGGDNHLLDNTRAAALMGATVLVAPHRSSGGADRNDDRDVDRLEQSDVEWLFQSMPSRAADNGMFVIVSSADDVAGSAGANGKAMIVDPCGRIVASANGSERMIAQAQIDPRLAETSPGRHWLSTRRPDLYRVLANAQERASQHGGARGSIAVSFAIVSRVR